MLFADRDLKFFFEECNLCLLRMLDSISLVNYILKSEMILKERADQKWLRLTPIVKAWVSSLYDLQVLFILFVELFLSSSLSKEYPQKVLVKG